MKAVSLLVCLFALATADFQVTFKAGVNVTLSNSNDFIYRKLSVNDVSIPRLYSALFVSSISVGANAASATSDGLFGTAYAGLNIAPSAYLAFYESAANWNVGIDYTDANVSSSKGFVGSVYISLEEVTPQGNVSQTVQLKSMSWSMESKSTGDGGLRYVTFLGTLSSQRSLNIRVTYIVSDVVGVLNVTGETVVTPKSLESIIQIDNFTYTDVQNSLRLNIGVGSATSSVQAQGTFVNLVAGDGASGAFFSVASVAQVDGRVTPVQIAAKVAAQADASFGNSNVAGQVSARYEGAADFKIVSATFPAGASQIVLDPAIGAGAAPPAVQAGTSTSSGQQAGVGTVVPSLFLLLAALFKLSM